LAWSSGLRIGSQASIGEAQGGIEPAQAGTADALDFWPVFRGAGATRKTAAITANSRESVRQRRGEVDGEAVVCAYRSTRATPNIKSA
jgi:hypothetical protein